MVSTALSWTETTGSCKIRSDEYDVDEDTGSVDEIK